MSSIDTRSPFFLRGGQSSKAESAKGGGQVEAPGRNTTERASEITNKTATDAKVNIPEGVKDFSKIKKAAMSAPDVDNTDKIARLKAQIEAGTYEIDYDGLADKILSSEF
jgi:negative regulator of flagellin synthesis FlgM